MPFDDIALEAEIPTLRRIAQCWWPRDPEDLVQATCEKALRSREQFHGGVLQAWLVDVVMRTVRLDMARHDGRRRHDSVDRLCAVADGSKLCDSRDAEAMSTPQAQDDTVMLHEAIEKLTAGSWLLPLAFGYSGDEIAAHYGVTRGKVHKRVFAERHALSNWSDQ